MHASVQYDENYANIDLGWFGVNNIVHHFRYSDFSPSIGVATAQAQRPEFVDGISDQSEATYDWTHTLVDRNLIHEPQHSGWHIGLPHSTLYKSSRWTTTDAFNAFQNVTNYSNSDAGLFIDDTYKTNPDFQLGDGVTIANGGIGGEHPFLDNVTIPTYVGAVNPDDNAWVDGVSSLSDLSVLQVGSDGDPSWVEGSACDLNGDSVVNSQDVTACVNAILDGGSADVTGDGITNMSDVIAVVNVILGS